MGYTVVRSYDPIKRDFTDPKIVERLDAIKICLDTSAVMSPVGDSKEEAAQRYWKAMHIAKSWY
jgi:hypothetical protein